MGTTDIPKWTHALTYPSYPDRCGWNAMLPARPPKPAATRRIAVKYAVVGAGFTGLAAARRLAELDPTADIAVVEATTVGEGSSARNSGFISPTDLPAGTSASDLQRNEAVNRFGAEGFDWLVALTERYGIDCELQKSGRIKAAATELGERSVEELRDIVEALNIPHRTLDRAGLRERVGTGYYRSGLFTEGGYLVQPAALIRGLADNLPASVQLFENTPVLELRRSNKWRLQIPDGEIIADTVVMAVNAAIKGFGYLRDRLVTIYTYAAITKQLPEADIPQLGSMPVWGILPSHRLGTTVRRVGRDRLMVRSLYAYEQGVSPDKVHAELLARFHNRYPDLAHVDLDFVWGGTTALTMNGSPFWGRLDEGLYTSAGCNGAGVVKGTVLGKRLAEEIAGASSADEIRKWYGSADWIAPEPFRTIGFHVVSAIERRKAGLES